VRQLLAAREHVLERDGSVRELVHRQPEQPSRGERCQPQLDAGMRRGALDERRPVVQAGDEGVAHLPVDRPRRSEVEDQRDARERHLAQARPGASALRPGPDRADEVRSELWRGRPGCDLPHALLRLAPHEIHHSTG
jgi:hypothetical protein